MPPERTSKSPAVTQAEEALHSVGARNAVFDQRPVGRRNWFADWAGRLSGSDVYIGITGKTSAPRTVRLLLDDWIFDDVASRDLGALLSAIFSAGATLTKKRSLLLVPVQVLKVPVGRSRYSLGRSHYSAARKIPPDAELSPWERRILAADGDS